MSISIPFGRIARCAAIGGVGAATGGVLGLAAGAVAGLAVGTAAGIALPGIPLATGATAGTQIGGVGGAIYGGVTGAHMMIEENRIEEVIAEERPTPAAKAKAA